MACGRDSWNTSSELLSGLGYLVGVPVAPGSLTGIIREARARRVASRAQTAPLAESAPSPSYVPTSDAVQAELLKHIVALRDSGALTDKECLAEKPRIEMG